MKRRAKIPVIVEKEENKVSVIVDDAPKKFLSKKDIENAMDNVPVEHKGKWNRLYRGAYVICPDKKWRGIKNVCAEALGHRIFSTKNGEDILNMLGFSTGRDRQEKKE